MLPFLKKGKGRGLTCIGLEADGFTLAHVVRSEDERPHLQVCDYRRHEEGQSLEREIAAALRDYGLRGSNGVCVLPPSSYSLRLVDAPEVGPEFMKEAVRYSIADLIDFDVDQAVIDVFNVPDQADGRGQSLYVVAARAAQIEETSDMLRDGGLALGAIDITELALRNVAMLTQEDQGGVALLYLRPESGVITLTRNGNLYMTRNTEVGLQNFSAESASDPFGEKPEGNEETDEAFESLLLELQRSLDYYEHQLGQTRANNVLIAPLGRDIPRLQEYLTENLSVNVRFLDLSAALASEHEIARDLQARCLVAIGGALRVSAA